MRYSIIRKEYSMYIDIGIVLLYLPSYSPDLNPTEEFFRKLKMYIKQA